MNAITSVGSTLKLHHERTFVELLKVGYSDLTDKFKWTSAHATSGVRIVGMRSERSQESLPGIAVSVGDLTDFKGSIDHLKAWGAQFENRLYTDQSQVRMSHYADNEDDAARLGEFSRRLLFAAKQSGDLGRRGVFGLQNLTVSAPQPAFPGTKRDNHFVCHVDGAFMTITRQTTTPGEGSPLWDDLEIISPGGTFPMGTGGTRPGGGGFPGEQPGVPGGPPGTGIPPVPPIPGEEIRTGPGSGTPVVVTMPGPGGTGGGGWPGWFPPGAAPGVGTHPSTPGIRPTAAGASLITSVTRGRGPRILVQFDRVVDTVQVYGFTLHAPGGDVELSGVRDQSNHRLLMLDAPKSYNRLLRLWLSYAGGNVKVVGANETTVAISAFGPVPVTEVL